MASGHQITITPIDRHVEVTLGGEKLATSDRALLLQETGSPDRYYLPADDVRTELLRPTSTTSTCPFKGEAAYWSVEAGGEVHRDVAAGRTLAAGARAPGSGIALPLQHATGQQRRRGPRGERPQPGPRPDGQRAEVSGGLDGEAGVHRRPALDPVLPQRLKIMLPRTRRKWPSADRPAMRGPVGGRGPQPKGCRPIFGAAFTARVWS